MVGDWLEEGVGLGCCAHQDALAELEGRARVLGVAVASPRYLLTMGAVEGDVSDALAGEAEKEISFRHGCYLDLGVFDLACSAVGLDGSAGSWDRAARNVLMRFDTLKAIGIGVRRGRR